jgi:hypothetical protein
MDAITDTAIRDAYTTTGITTISILVTDIATPRNPMAMVTRLANTITTVSTHHARVNAITDESEHTSLANKLSTLSYVLTTRSMFP